MGELFGLDIQGKVAIVTGASRLSSVYCAVRA